MKVLTEEMDNLTVADVIKKAAVIRHRIAVIHPFGDGNGRCSRALLNWTYRPKGLPPIYIKYPEKDEYFEGLSNIDKNQSYDKLFKVFMREVIRNSMQLNKVSLDKNTEA